MARRDRNDTDGAPSTRIGPTAGPAAGRPGRAAYHHGDLRSALIAAAEAELAENGLAGFSLRATARRAGVSHAAPAHHFASADALLAALACLGFERLVAAMETEMTAAGEEPRARLAASGRGYVAFARANPHLFQLMFVGGRPRTLAETPGEGTAEAPARAFSILRGAVEAARAPDPSQAALARDVAAAWGLVHGLAQLLIEDAAGFLQPFPAPEREAIVSAAIERFAAGLA